MEEVIRFALLGFGAGTLYALSAQGLIVIYRGSGVLNFAMGAIGMAGAFLQWDLSTREGWNYWLAFAIAVLFAVLIGLAIHMLIMRPLRRASPLARVVATLGVLVTLEALAVLRYGATPQFALSKLPTEIVTIHGSISISADRLILLGIATVMTILLWVLYRYTKFGIATSAVAENERSAQAVGISPDRVASANWMLGCALAAFAGIMIAPVLALQVSVLSNLIIAALAAALVARFRSFPIALLAGVGIGVLQAEVTRYVEQPGLSGAVPFIVVIFVLVATGQALPLRDYFLQRMPALGSGRIYWPGIALATAVAVFLLAVLSNQWVASITTTMCTALLLLSIVVVTGYAGQISLGQLALGGFGAWVAGRLVAAEGLPFWLGMLIGVIATIPLGVLFAMPAVRTRGINLAVVTLGLGTAVELLLFDNANYTGGIQGTQVGKTSLFGFDINSIAHPTRYALFVLGALLVCSILVANLRRGSTGRRLIAVRTNERAAAALGISVPVAKLYAFGASAAIAAIGGILVAFQTTSINYTQFESFTSVTYVGLAVVGGIGFLIGPVIGATLVAGGVAQQLLTTVFSEGIGRYISLIGGVSIIVLTIISQNGVADRLITLAKGFAPRLPPSRSRRDAPEDTEVLEQPPSAPAAFRTIVAVQPMVLEVQDLSVRYGNTVAVDSVSLTIKPGRVIGLIGANGAGKTTFIDAVTGFTKVAGGKLTLDGQEVTRWSAAKRARAGIGRSFQSLELFDDLTVIENLRVAADRRDFLSYVSDPIRPVNPPLPEEVVSAIEEFELAGDLHVAAEELPYGKRRLLAIARAVASTPSVLLLDEPAAGLSEAETDELAELIRKLVDKWGMGILLVEHDVNFVMGVCDEVQVLDFGRTIAAGPPEQVRRDPRVIAAYVGEFAPVPESGQPPALRNPPAEELGPMDQEGDRE